VTGSPLRAIAAVRLGLGLGAWLMPRLGGRLFGLDPRGNPQVPYIARLFGARDVALAAGALLSEDEPRRLWLQAGLGCDVADTAAGLAAGLRGYLGPVSAALVTGAAVGAGALSVAALRAEEAE
jgi:hypothetical protein